LGKIRFERISDVFSKKSTVQYELSVLIGLDSSSYFFADRRNHLLGIRQVEHPGTSLEAAIEDLLNTDPVLQRPFAKTTIASRQHRFTLVPARLYEEKEKRQYLEQVLRLEPQEQVQSERMPEAGLVLVSAANTRFLNELQHSFPGNRHFPLALPLLKGILKQGNGRSIWINVHPGTITLLAAEGEKILFFNTFHYQTARDVVYYTLLVYEELGWATVEVPLYYSGQLLLDSELMNQLCRYLPRPRAQGFPPWLSVHNQPALPHPHLFFDLLSIPLCY
jgi:hypothetical protein